MAGYNVLHPMCWDAFGLPAEQYAIDTGTHPSETTKRNINRFREQLKVRLTCWCAPKRLAYTRPTLQSLGFSYDWEREVATCDAAYYRWTQVCNCSFALLASQSVAYRVRCPDAVFISLQQWIFLRLFERGLAYQVRNPRENLGSTPSIDQLSRSPVQAEVAVNWCPALGTVLANEEVRRVRIGIPSRV